MWTWPLVCADSVSTTWPLVSGKSPGLGESGGVDRGESGSLASSKGSSVGWISSVAVASSVLDTGFDGCGPLRVPLSLLSLMAPEFSCDGISGDAVVSVIATWGCWDERGEDTAISTECAFDGTKSTSRCL